MRHTVQFGLLTVVLLVIAACGDSEPLSMSRTHSQSYRLDIGAGVVAVFVEDLSLGLPDLVAYITHVSSGWCSVVQPMCT